MPQTVYDITPEIKYLATKPPIPGYEEFIGTYLILGEKRALVDIGPRVAVPGLLSALSLAGVRPVDIDYIILTHIHIDHAGGTGTAIKEMKNARVLTHSRGKAHLIDPAVLWQASQDTLGELAIKYGSYEPVSEERIITAQEGVKLDLGKGLTLEIYLTPGHAAHHMSLYEIKNDVLFSGDSAGVYTNGLLRLTTPPTFRLGESLESLDKMIGLHPKKLGYAHFGCYDNAVERLHAYRGKLLLVYEIAQSGAKEGKTVDDVIKLIRAHDRSFDDFEKLDKDIYQREYDLLSDSVRGLMTAKQ